MVYLPKKYMIEGAKDEIALDFVRDSKENEASHGIDKVSSPNQSDFIDFVWEIRSNNFFFSPLGLDEVII